MQPPGSVDDDGIDAVLCTHADGLVRDARRVGALGSAYRLGADAIAPRFQLVGGGRAKGVCGAEQDGVSVGDQHPGELSRGRRLAGPVDADDERDGWAVLVSVEVQRPVVLRSDEGDELLAQHGLGLGGCSAAHHAHAGT